MFASGLVLRVDTFLIGGGMCVAGFFVLCLIDQVEHEGRRHVYAWILTVIFGLLAGIMLAAGIADPHPKPIGF